MNNLSTKLEFPKLEDIKNNWYKPEFFKKEFVIYENEKYKFNIKMSLSCFNVCKSEVVYSLYPNKMYFGDNNKVSVYLEHSNQDMVLKDIYMTAYEIVRRHAYYLAQGFEATNFIEDYKDKLIDEKMNIMFKKRFLRSKCNKDWGKSMIYSHYYLEEIDKMKDYMFFFYYLKASEGDLVKHFLSLCPLEDVSERAERERCRYLKKLETTKKSCQGEKRIKEFEELINGVDCKN